MKNAEKLATELSKLSSEVNNERLFDGADQDFVEEFDGSTQGDNKEITQTAGSENLGNFKDAESLFKAYKSLQSEFTKKSQRLSELESELAPLTRIDKINATIDELFERYSPAEPLREKLKENLASFDGDVTSQLAEQNLIKILVENFVSPQELVKDEMFLSNHIFNNLEIKDAIIKEYLSELKSAPNIKVATNFNSSIIASPPVKVKTIKEAGSIARSIIKKQ